MGQPKRVEDAKILVANTPMDTDKIKIYGARVRVDSMQKARLRTAWTAIRCACQRGGSPSWQCALLSPHHVMP